MYRAASILATLRGMPGTEPKTEELPKDSRLVEDPGKTPGKAEGERDGGRGDQKRPDATWPRETIK
jgi:hypothetical protein